MTGGGYASAVDRLRAEFDGAFAAAEVAQDDSFESLLVLRASDLTVAVRAREVASIHRAPHAVPVPTAAASLVGLASVRGDVIGVHSLAALLRRSQAGPTKWMLLCANDPSLALSFDELIAYEPVHIRSIRSAKQGDAVQSIAELSIGPVPIVRVGLIVNSIRTHAGTTEELQHE